MKLPNSGQAKVEGDKILEYLLNFSHPDGSGKAKFFWKLGFTIKKWETLSEALCKHGKDNTVSKVIESIFGTRYIVDGVLETPDNRNPNLRSVWLIEKGSDIPRLITAYPLEEARNDKGT